MVLHVLVSFEYWWFTVLFDRFSAWVRLVIFGLRWKRKGKRKNFWSPLFYTGITGPRFVITRVDLATCFITYIYKLMILSFEGSRENNVCMGTFANSNCSKFLCSIVIAVITCTVFISCFARMKSTTFFLVCCRMLLCHVQNGRLHFINLRIRKCPHALMVVACTKLNWIMILTRNMIKFVQIPESTVAILLSKVHGVPSELKWLKLRDIVAEELGNAIVWWYA